MSRAALIIGINEYWCQELGSLQYAESDCRRLAKAFCRQGYGFDAENVHVRTASEIPQTQQPYKSALCHESGLFAPFSQEEWDLFVFVFVGHGFERKDQSFLIPVDVMGRSEGENFIPDIDTCVPLAAILDRVVAVPARQKLMILDICRVGETGGRSSGLPESFAAECRSVEDVQVLSACGVGQESWEDSDLEAGVYVGSLSDGLEGGLRSQENGSKTVYSLQTYAEEQVSEWTKLHTEIKVPQRPVSWGAGSTIYLTGVQPEKLPRSLTDSLSRTQNIVSALDERLKDVDSVDFEDYWLRINANLSSFAVSENEPVEDSNAARELHKQLIKERDLLKKFFLDGAKLKAIFTWNLDWFLSAHRNAKLARARLTQLKDSIEFILKDGKLVERAEFIHIPVSERNLLFLGDDYLFVGRKLYVGGGFDATEVIRDKDKINAEIEIFDTLFDNGLDYYRKEKELDPQTTGNRELLEAVRDDLCKDLKRLDTLINDR